MSPRGKLVVWSVAVVVFLAGLAAARRVWPDMDFEDYGALVIALAVLCVSIWAPLHFTRKAREERARHVRSLDQVMRAVAGQTGDGYSAGGSYEHPMIETIYYPGRLRGSRGTLSLEVFLCEEEDGYDLRVLVWPIAGKNTRLKPHSPQLSPLAQRQVKELLVQCDRVSIDQPPPRRGQPQQPSRLICSAGSSRLDAMTAEGLLGLIERTVALAHELPAS